MFLELLAQKLNPAIGIDRVIEQAMNGFGQRVVLAAGQRMLAAAMDTPVSVMPTSGEGGPWGMALLAAFAAHRSAGEPLEEYLATKVFATQQVTTVAPPAQDAAGFAAYLTAYEKGLAAERAAVEAIR